MGLDGKDIIDIPVPLHWLQVEFSRAFSHCLRTYLENVGCNGREGTLLLILHHQKTAAG